MINTLGYAEEFCRVKGHVKYYVTRKHEKIIRDELIHPKQREALTNISINARMT